MLEDESDMVNKKPTVKQEVMGRLVGKRLCIKCHEPFTPLEGHSHMFCPKCAITSEVSQAIGGLIAGTLTKTFNNNTGVGTLIGVASAAVLGTLIHKAMK